jgi:ABC-2 type transport system ATP-binding protein
MIEGQAVPQPLLEIAHLTKSYDRWTEPAIVDVNLAISGGEILGLVGLNGAGKTTTIRVAAGLLRPTSGTVRVVGFDIVREKVAASKHLGLVPESPYFDPMARALPLLRYLAGFRGLDRTQATESCQNLLTLVGLDKVVKSRIGTFSQGMKKRFALAAALIGDPEALLLDEVLNGLDPEGIVETRELMLQMKERGKSILLSSHMLHEVQHVADRVAVIHRGRVVKILLRGEIDSSSSKVLRISFVRVDDDALSYLATLGEIRREGATVWVTDPDAGAEEINANLTRKGYGIRHLSFEPMDLEDLFFQWVDEASPPASPETPKK